MTTAERQLFVIRHGETGWALLGRHTGRTDVPLTPRGREQAHAIGQRLADHRFALVLTSPLSRARDTAELAGFPDAQVEPDLREWDYGELEGLTTPEIRTSHPEWTIWSGPWLGGERPEDVGSRADRVIARCVAPDVDGDVLLFGHGHALRVLAARWLGLAPTDGRMFALETATLGILGWDRGDRVIERWNEACHLG